MKKILVLLILVLTISSCEGTLYIVGNYAQEQIHPDAFADMKEDIENDEIRRMMENQGIFSETDILNWTSNNIDYLDQTDYYGFEFGVQNPYTTYATKQGNCEAFCALVKFMFEYRQLDIQIYGVYIPRLDLKHAIIKTNTGFFDLQKDCYVDNDIESGSYKILYEVEYMNFI